MAVLNKSGLISGHGMDQQKYGFGSEFAGDLSAVVVHLVSSLFCES